MTYDFDKFEETLKKWQISLSKEQEQQFLDYYEMLIEKNKVMNLTAVTEFSDVLEKHFLDSISLCQIENLDKNASVLDMGTGAGFPGIPLKIIFPKLSVTLADSLNKRIVFLDEVIDKLQLSDISTVHARAEELAKNMDYREQFDYCVSRAVANLSTLSEYCLPFVKCGGSFISYKSGEIEEEANQAKHAIFLLGGKLEKIEKFELADTELHRSFVIIKKEKKTSKAYPRKAGTPAKTPLQ